MDTWATKYRPRKLDDVLGQEHAAKAVTNILRTNQYHPLYMVTGAWGAGKTTLLRIFAAALTCTEVERGEGCGKCQACVGVAIYQHNDNYLEIDAADHGSVDDIRKLIHNSTITVTGKARARVVLLDECHMLSKAAQNALLKLFEEGSQTTVYMLATTDPQKLLPTIGSRAIKWVIKPIPREKIQQKLVEIARAESVEIETEAARIIVQQTRGHVRDAITLLEQTALSGPVTVKTVSEYLELDRDKEVARVILNLQNSPDTAYKQLEDLLVKQTPEGVWQGARRILTEAVRVKRSNEQEHPLQSILDELNNTFREELTQAVEWILSTYIKPETQTEVICAVALLQSKLVVDSKAKKTRTVTAGVQQRHQMREGQKEVMTVSEFMERMGWVEKKLPFGGPNPLK